MDSRQRDRSLCGFRPGAFLATITIGIVLAGTLQTTAARGQGLAGVAALQVGLRAHGFYAGPVDGLFGPQTAKAIRTLQRRHGLLVDGVPGPRTRAALGRYGRPRLGSRLLRRGVFGRDVAMVQFMLARCRTDPGPVDASFERETTSAVRRYQQRAGAATDGVVGPTTLRLLTQRRSCGSSPSGRVAAGVTVSGALIGGLSAAGQTMLCARHSPIHCGWPSRSRLPRRAERARTGLCPRRGQARARGAAGRCAQASCACATSPSQGVGGMAGASGVSTTGQLTLDRGTQPAAAAESPAVGVPLVSRGSCKSVRQAPRESGPFGHPRPHSSCSAERYSRELLGPIIVVRRKAHRLSLYDGTRLVHTFRVGTGKRGFPTPLGRFSIVSKARNPWWIPPKSGWAQNLQPIPPGPGNPLGTRWMGLSSPGVGIHGTPTPRRSDIPGRTAAYGCTSRMPSGFSARARRHAGCDRPRLEGG